FADEIIVSKNALSHLDEEESTVTETRKYSVATGSTQPEIQDDITESPQENHTEESMKEVLVETNALTETLVDHEWATDNEAKLNDKSTSSTEDLLEPSELTPHDSHSEASESNHETSEPTGQTDTSTSEPQISMPVEIHPEETLEGLTRLFRKVNENVDGLIKFIKSPELLEEKLKNITKPFLSDVESVAETHLARLLGQDVDEESSLKAKSVSDEFSGVDGSQDEYKFPVDTLETIEAMEPSTEIISTKDQENGQ
ncbi:hypothetical protein X801_07381, partial [Opisthorchis viverrini]